MLSIGSDIVKIDRIKELSNDDKFLGKIFTEKEIGLLNGVLDNI